MKFKYGWLTVLFMSVLMLILLWDADRPAEAAAGADVVSGGGVTIVSGTAINYVRVHYTDEEMVVNSNYQLYYCMLKKASDVSAKVSDLMPAARENYNAGAYLIDLSTMSSSKTGYVGLVSLQSLPDSGTVPVSNVRITGSQKKVVFNLAWGMEGPDHGDYELLDSVIVTNFDNETITYDHKVSGSSQTATHKTLSSDNIEIEWRKGANCAWKSLSDLDALTWNSMIKSGAIVYFRVAARNDTTSVPGQRFSKESKVKFTVTKPSALKIDVSKLTVNLKNGMQFKSKSINNANAWKTILPYSANSTNTTALRDSALSSTLFDPYTEATSEKVTYLSIQTIRSTIGGQAMATSGPFTIETRIAATTKKPPAQPATLVLLGQAAAPTIPSPAIVKSQGDYTIGQIVKSEGDNDAAGYEYFFCKKTDVNDIDLAQIKWSSVKSGSVLKGSLKSQYSTVSSKQRREVLLSDKDVVILIRRKGTKDSGKKEGMLASKYIKIDVP